MNKLTTGRLEKLQDNLLQFQDAYSDPADKENYDIFVDALHVLDEFKAAKEKLLAYEQAAKNPIGSFHISGGQVEATTDYCRDGEWPVQDGEVLVYAAPVLPKQPELVDLSQQVETLNRILNWILKELPVPTQKASAMAIRLSSVIDVISDLEIPAPAQPVSEPSDSPVIPDGWKLVPIEPTAAMFHAFNDCDYGRKSMRERYIQMIEAAPAQEQK
ncbi:hypothetical protein [Hafnia paralvei]|uniref:hypothetical protein n=1 Tax=Hafnia paralvei TaxID=546367 RepID=UPI0018F0A9A3|nr:hypothetical protein [Hafnia paralvei]MBW2958930.1 hypothetical protein [Hafnia paralvei]